MTMHRKWCLTSFAVLISGLFVVGCGGSSPGALSNGPTVAMTIPSPTTDVAIDSGIQLTFSKDMNPGTVTVNFTPSVTVSATDWPDTKTLVLLPASLNHGTTYQVDVAGSDNDSNALVGTTSFSFTTVDVPPEVLSTSPANSATDVPVTTNISFSFSKAMSHSSVEGAFSSTPSITCAWSWSGDSTLATCSHVTDFTASSSYSITLGTGACDQAATPSCLAAAYTFAFQTAAAPDTTPPTVSSSTPTSGATGASRSISIVVTFSEPMDKASAQTAFAITSPSGHNSGIFSWNTGGTQMTFNPDSDFNYDDNVTWRVSTAAEDFAGNAMAADYTSSFKVIRQGSASLYSVASLDGYIISDGTVRNAGYTGFCVGDYNNNTFWRGFLSFDLSSLPGTLTSITSTTLRVYQYNVTGNPYTDLIHNSVSGDDEYLRAESVNYGGSLSFAAFETPILQTFECHPVCTLVVCHLVCGNVDVWATLSSTGATTWKSVDVRTKVVDDWTNRTSRGSRSQFRLKFPTNTDSLSDSDYTCMYSGDYASKPPTLDIVYEYP